MNDTIQKAGSEVSIVIYDAPLPPRYFRFTKKFIRTFFVVVPVLFVVSLLALFLWGLGPRIMNQPRPRLPEVISPDDSQLAQLETEVKSLQQINKDLTDKLSSLPASPAGGAEEPYLMGIIRPYGMQNFLSQNRVTLDQFEFVQNANDIALKFQIISSSPEIKVTGHVIVFMVTPSGLMAYPADANNGFSQGIKFSMGEPFSVSRLRPTSADFITKLNSPSAKFVIYIFSREGDLLLIKETETFKTATKS